MGTVDYTQPKFTVRGTFTCHPEYSTFPATDYDYSIVTLASNVDLNDADVSFYKRFKRLSTILILRKFE